MNKNLFSPLSQSPATSPIAALVILFHLSSFLLTSGVRIATLLGFCGLPFHEGIYAHRSFWSIFFKDF